MRDRTANDSEVFLVHIIDHVTGAIVQAAQLQSAFPVSSKERVVRLLVLADDLDFGQIKTNIVEGREDLIAQAWLTFALQKRSSAVCMCRLARIAAMMPSTRLRPSSIRARYIFRLLSVWKDRRWHELAESGRTL